MAGTLPSAPRGSAADRHHGHRGADARGEHDRRDLAGAVRGPQRARPGDAVRSVADRLRGRGRGEGLRRRGAMSAAARRARWTGSPALSLVAAREAWANAGTPSVEPARGGVVLRHRRRRPADGDRPGGDPGGAPRPPLAALPAELPGRHADQLHRHRPAAARARTSRSSRPAPPARTRSAWRPTMLRRGEADVMLAGGAECGVLEVLLAGFTVMKALGKPRPGEPRRRRRHARSTHP